MGTSVQIYSIRVIRVLLVMYASRCPILLAEYLGNALPELFFSPCHNGLP